MADHPHLFRALSTVEYFTFDFGTMIGVGWLVLIDDRLSRGGAFPARAGALAGAAVAAGIVLMKRLPFVPGSSTRAERLSLAVRTASAAAFRIARPHERTA